jgi:predicted DNA binding protein
MSTSDLNLPDECMYAASFETRHDCVLGNKSGELPDLRIAHWCVPGRAIFQVGGPDDQIQSFLGWADEALEVAHSSLLSEGALLITRRCCRVVSGRSILELIEQVDAWDIPPIVYRNGWESWRIIAWGERSVKDLFKELQSHGKVRVTSIRPIENVEMEKMMLVPASDIFTGLTDRQVSALILGLERGRYSVPSETKIKRLAQGIGLAPSTLAEHMRKAEKRILRNLFPYLQAYARRKLGEPVLAEVRKQPHRRMTTERSLLKPEVGRLGGTPR